MWDMSVEQVLEIVEEINDELLEQQQCDSDKFFQLETLIGWGSVVSVNFIGYPVWCSEDDERPWLDEDGDNIEPLDTFLRRECQQIIDHVGGLRLKGHNANR